MAQAGGSLTKLYWNRHRSAGLTLLLVLQKALFIFFGVMLLVPLFIALSAGSVLQARGQTTSASVSSSVPEQPDLPDAPSASPDPQQSSQSNIPFLSPRFGPVGQMDIRKKFNYFVDPACRPPSVFPNPSTPGKPIANPPHRSPP